MSAALAPPSGVTNAVALRKSGLSWTSVTVTLASNSAGSRSSPGRSNRASACRTSSPTRNWRWLRSPVEASWRSRRAIELPTRSQSAGDFLDLKAFDHIADGDVFVILEGHAAFVAVAHLAY